MDKHELFCLRILLIYDSDMEILGISELEVFGRVASITSDDGIICREADAGFLDKRAKGRTNRTANLLAYYTLNEAAGDSVQVMLALCEDRFSFNAKIDRGIG